VSVRQGADPTAELRSFDHVIEHSNARLAEIRQTGALRLALASALIAFRVCV
jgi:hypothetical protein